VAGGVAALVTLAGCGSSAPSGAAGATSTTVGGTSASAPTTGSSGPTSNLFVTGPVPAVSGATDLQKEPTVAAGRGTPPTEVTGRDLVVGTGAVAGPGATVTVQYVGALWSTGKVFDASWTDQGPASFPLSGVIAGFRDAIVGMRIGGRREVVIPPAEGYGAAGSPPAIPANATLVFVIDLLQVNQ
jgi:peptidylprolyl isomerase